MYTFKIINLDTAYSQADNSHFIDLEVEIYKDEELFETRKFGYPLNTPETTIVGDLERLCTTLASDEEVAASSAELESGMAHVASLKESLLPKEETE